MQRGLLALMGVIWLAGCPWVDPQKYDEIRDADGDGEWSVRFGGNDCVDGNPAIAHCDADGDGAMTAAAGVGGTDCDDNDATVSPNATERCDGIDNDCDGAIDNADPSVESPNTFYADSDGDGDGDPNATVACQEYTDPADFTTAVYATNGDDCNDNDPTVRSGADELCDGIDNNCDGAIDDVGLWFVDNDGDGVGTSVQSSGDCDLANESGLAAVSGDCDDTDPDRFPGNIEVPYDGIDANCDGGRDDWDADADGRVPAEHWAAAIAAQQASGDDWGIEIGDCDDQQSLAFDGNAEVCDGIDNDCDGQVDSEDLDSGDEPALQLEVVTVFEDVDGDGFAGSPILLCPGEVDSAVHAITEEDCFEGGAGTPFGSTNPVLVHDGAEERCDGVDNDCNDRVDWDFDPLTDPQANEHYIDRDGDSFGQDVVFACGPVGTEGIVAAGGDCNEFDEDIYPGATEVCGDAIRQDCSDLSLYDCDGDGQDGAYADGGDGQDCDDANPAVFATDEANTELCDGFDNNCDGEVDSADTDNLDASSAASWYPDLDGDGFGNSAATPENQCDAPGPTYAPQGGDCDDADPDNAPDVPWYRDEDGDGFGTNSSASVSGCLPPDDSGSWVRAPGDCNDADPSLSPLTEWFPDNDGDLVGDPTGVVIQCTDPGGHVRGTAGVDCNDADPLVNAQSIWYRDADFDGWGDPDEAVEACAPPVIDGITYVLAVGDCEDGQPTVNPVQTEICDGIDNDCDGFVDDADDTLIATAGPQGFRDADGDGFGDDGIVKTFCVAVPDVGWATRGGDCNDDDVAFNPGQPDDCTTIEDEDCNPSSSEPVWYDDGDGDGFGVASSANESCAVPSAPGTWVLQGDDCNDGDVDIFPGAAEQPFCDGIDSNCDGSIEPFLTWYFDRDGDGLGDRALIQTGCVQPVDPPSPGLPGTWVLDGGDCDDADEDVTIGFLWYRDEDSDGLGLASTAYFSCETSIAGSVQVPGDCNDDTDTIGAARPYYVDEDDDGFGTASDVEVLCPGTGGGTPDGYSAMTGDCDDDNPSVNPDADDTPGDGVDNDCDGFVDSTSGGIQWYADADGDGIGSGSPLAGFQPGAVTTSGDCDDANVTIGAGRFVYEDADSDGFGAGAATFRPDCTLPVGFSYFDGDCHDGDGGISPGESETCDGQDTDCNGVVNDGAPGAVFEIPDRDGDGAVAPGEAPRWMCPADGPSEPATADVDCNDFDPAIRPSAPEICDGVDNDCNPMTQETLLTFYLDADGDTYGGAAAFEACSPPSPAWVTNDDDCDDGNPGVHPGAAEICNGEDDNCLGGPDDGLTAWTGFADFDADGRTDGTAVTFACDGLQPDHFQLTPSGSDCDDMDPTVYVGAPELCDGLDNDCDGVGPNEEDIDGDGFRVCDGDPLDGDPTVVPGMSKWYADNDGDSFGDDTDFIWSFGPESGRSTVAGDCDDDSASAHPAFGTELCDGIDNNCDGHFVRLGGPGGAIYRDIASGENGLNIAVGEQVLVADRDGDGTPNLEDYVTACTFLPAGSTVTTDTLTDAPLLDTDPFGAIDILSWTDCVDGPGLGSGTMYLLDADADGFGELDLPLRVHVDCGGDPAPSGFEPTPDVASLDCAPKDASRYQPAPAGVFIDQDGDGHDGARETFGGECAGITTTVPGNDCNDFDFDPDPTRSNFSMPIYDQQDFDNAWANCENASLDLFGTNLSFPAATTRDDASLQLWGFNGGCFVGNTDGCIGGTLSPGANAIIDFSQTGVTGTVLGNSTTTYVFNHDVRLVGTGSVQIAGGSLNGALWIEENGQLVLSAGAVATLDDLQVFGDTATAPAVLIDGATLSTTNFYGGSRVWVFDVYGFNPMLDIQNGGADNIGTLVEATSGTVTVNNLHATNMSGPLDIGIGADLTWNGGYFGSVGALAIVDGTARFENMDLEAFGNTGVPITVSGTLELHDHARVIAPGLSSDLMDVSGPSASVDTFRAMIYAPNVPAMLKLTDEASATLDRTTMALFNGSNGNFIATGSGSTIESATLSRALLVGGQAATCPFDDNVQGTLDSISVADTWIPFSDFYLNACETDLVSETNTTFGAGTFIEIEPFTNFEAPSPEREMFGEFAL